MGEEGDSCLAPPRIPVKLPGLFSLKPAFSIPSGILRLKSGNGGSVGRAVGSLGRRDGAAAGEAEVGGIVGGRVGGGVGGGVGRRVVGGLVGGGVGGRVGGGVGGRVGGGVGNRVGDFEGKAVGNKVGVELGKSEGLGEIQPPPGNEQGGTTESSVTKGYPASSHRRTSPPLYSIPSKPLSTSARIARIARDLEPTVKKRNDQISQEKDTHVKH
eukprot:scaffold6155_cov108-Cylindrotheca_fusiformis.AAC.9